MGDDEFTYVVDVSLERYQEGVIMVLDSWLGVVEIPIGKEAESNVIVPQRMCESFDTMEKEHIVLICQDQGHTTIIEAYWESNMNVYKRLEPVFKADYLNDLWVGKRYSLVYSYNSLHVFWNT